ncbi:hypothetical protein [Rhabdochromatium marinum]|uniref:hypothetical protein n=1 Tax=Rhabdochromatium marinum TaxID=48729 RepID=UPI001905B49C|nr:hypothetical protein [Rhabdochromatium marinum]MBK1650242.1 hypothetical protein [Rhabdochromatium marinum]
MAPPDAYLSYREADGTYLLTVLRELQRPAVAIFGSADHHLPSGWLDEVAAIGQQVRLVNGAGHFFANGYEFELQDAVLDALSTLESTLPETQSP